MSRNHRRNSRGNFILKREQVSDVTVIPFKPQVIGFCCIDKLGQNPKPVSRFAHAAFDDEFNAKLLACINRINLLPAEVER